MKNVSYFEKLKNDLAKTKSSKNNSNNQNDDDFWQAQQDKVGNGSAVIRFLPGKTEEDTPWVKLFKHGFQGPKGKWFIAECPTTIGQPCGCCTANNALWDSKDEDQIEIARSRKRKLSYVANVLIISDPANPENEGKVKLFRFGAKIMGKIEAAMTPEFEDDTPINPFDLEYGANFRLKMAKVNKFTNFDKSSFADSSSVGTAAFQASLKDQLHDIQKFLAPSLYMDEATMQKKLDFVLGEGDRRTSTSRDDEDEEDAKFAELARKAKARRVEEAEPVRAPAKRTLSMEDDDDMMEEFKRLAEED